MPRSPVHLHLWPITAICAQAFNLVHHLLPGYHLPKHHVLPRWTKNKRDEEEREEGEKEREKEKGRKRRGRRVRKCERERWER